MIAYSVWLCVLTVITHNITSVHNASACTADSLSIQQAVATSATDRPTGPSVGHAAAHGCAVSKERRSAAHRRCRHQPHQPHEPTANGQQAPFSRSAWPMRSDCGRPRASPHPRSPRPCPCPAPAAAQFLRARCVAAVPCRGRFGHYRHVRPTDRPSRRRRVGEGDIAGGLVGQSRRPVPVTWLLITNNLFPEMSGEFRQSSGALVNVSPFCLWIVRFVK